MVPSVFKRVADELKGLPGIGPKSAERIIFFLLSTKKEKGIRLANAISDLISRTSACKTCGLISEYNPCRICSSPNRDRNLICLVKGVQDALSIERSRAFKGLYHVLGGLLSADGNAEGLNVSGLINRIDGKKEIIFAFESCMEAEQTIRFVVEKIKDAGKSQTLFSRMAIGIPIGASLEYVDDDTIRQSFSNRYGL